MGGPGSGRPPLPENLLRTPERPIMPAEDFIIPNYSGLQAVKKTDPAIGVGVETDPVFMALSGSLITTETDPIYIATSGSFVKTETDPVFIATSGSFIQTETDPIFMALSGTIPVGTETDPLWTAASGSYIKGSGSTTHGVLLGYNAGYGNTYGQTTFIGSGSGYGTTKDFVVGIGYWALSGSTSDDSMALGYSAGEKNLGAGFVGMGYNAGYYNTGNYQTGVGYSAGVKNSATNHTAIGSYSGYYNRGNESCIIGAEAGWKNFGNFVTAIGYQAGYNNSGSDVIAIGYQAGYNNIVKGQFILRNSGSETFPLIQGCFMSGAVAIGKQYAKANLDVSGSFLASGNISGSSMNVGIASVLTAETDPIFLALSGSWNTDLASGSAHFYDVSDPHGTILNQTNIYGTLYSGSNILATNTLSGSTTLQITPGDHGYSGSSQCVGVIYNIAGDFPAANTTPIGTLAITYTA